MMRKLIALLIAAAACGFAQAPDGLVRGSRWIDHLNNELMPYWAMDAAYGTPRGAFPGTRCDDGTLYDPKKPCPEIQRNSWISPQQRTLVALSRQTYGYGVAFHMTGKREYLDLMKAGVDYIRKNAIDRVNGGMATTQNIADGSWVPAPEFRNTQELGYGLLGLAFYYYLTRDPEVLPDIYAAKDYIFQNFYNPSMGAMQWTLKDYNGTPATQKQLVAQLDQMNTYLVLLAPILPESWRRDDWMWTAQVMCYVMMSQFYSPQDRLFFLSANSPNEVSLKTAGTDFGHNAKALWMIRWTGLMSGDSDLVRFAEDNARTLFPRAYMADQATWAEGFVAGGGLDMDKSWWIFAELDQYAGTLSLREPSFAQYLPSTHDYWFRYFVDHTYGEVWNSVNGKTNAPIKDLPKSWQWKSAYHSLEHALVSYIVCQQLYGDPVTLYYAFTGTPAREAIRPYYFYGDVRSVEVAAGVQGIVQRVTFENVR